MATNRNIVYMLTRIKVCCTALTYNSVMLFDNYSGITLRNTNLSISNIQAPTPRLIIRRLPGNTTAIQPGCCQQLLQ